MVTELAEGATRAQQVTRTIYSLGTISILGAITIGAVSCAHPPNPRLGLNAYDVKKGYRFDTLAAPANSNLALSSSSSPNRLFVVLAFSGGGTRAAALSYGVLRQLQHVKLHVNLDNGEFSSCKTDDGHCVERSLLDEVDVISSVSGGSFTAAYYAINREKIFDTTDRFHRSFLYSPVQRELFGRAVYQPRNWANLGSRPEIAARLYGDLLFGQSTFADLRQRPFLILNATDASKGNRFEFTQEQFDMLCADLSPFPIARAVAASSAFPGLLNSMTIDSHNGPSGAVESCGYKGPGSGGRFDWTTNALTGNSRLDFRYAEALGVKAYLDPSRKYFHLLDGGLADNIGLRPILRSLGSFDRPTPSEGVQGGWSLLQLLNLGETDTVLVISVNARTDHAQDWDTHPAGPGTFSVINLSSGIPMGNYSSETLELLRQVAIANRLNEKDQPKLYGIEVSFDGLDATEQPFFRNLGTNFQLRPFEVDCLIDRGQRLLRTSTISTTETSTAFARFVENDLHGSIEIPTADSSTGSAPAACTPDAGTQRVGVRDHFLDVGIAATSVWPRTSLFNRNTSPGLAFRVVRPTGWNIALGIGPSSLSMSQRIDNQPLTIGDLRLFGFTGGLLRALRVGRLEATAGASGGYALGSFQLTTQARDAYARQGAFEITSRASNAWIAQPQSGLWFDLTNRFAITASAAYTVAHSTVRVSSDRAIINQRVDASALRVGFGVGYKIF